MRTTRVWALLAGLVACRGDRPKAPPEVATPMCTDTVETRAIACSGQTARRVGGTLFVRLDPGRDTAFVNDTGGEAPGGFQYEGRFGRQAFQLIQSNGHESYPNWIVMNPRTGHSATASDTPLLSPDSVRFATGGPSWDNCSESDGASLDVWRLTDTLPVLEWRVVTQDCKNPSFWGAIDLHWRAPDTLDFTRIDLLLPRTPRNASDTVEHSKRPMFAARDAAGWHTATPR